MGIAEIAAAIAARHGLSIVRDCEPERDHDALGRTTLLCTTEDGHKCVLSVGECRSVWASFLDGRTSVVELDGRASIVVPKVWHGYNVGEFVGKHPNDPPYEIEEYLPGVRFADRWPRQGIPFPPELCVELRNAYPAIERRLQGIPLPRRHHHVVGDWTARCAKRIAQAGFPAIARLPRALQALAALRRDEFVVVYGHFTLTHLIAMSDARVGCIDLAHVRWAPRHYDLAFLLWAAWFHTDTEVLADPVAALAWMEEFFAEVSGAKRAERKDMERELHQFRRVLLERAFGALADLRQDVEHAHRIIGGDDARRARIVQFLQGIVRLLT